MSMPAGTDSAVTVSFHQRVPHYVPATFICCADRNSYQAQPGKNKTFLVLSEGDYTVHSFLLAC